MRMNILPARIGITWVKLGVQTFFKQPLALGGLFFMFMALTSLASILPVVGTVLGLALIPAATLGLMVATLETLRGKFPMPSVLFTALRSGKERLQKMLLLGGIYAAAFLVVMLVVGAIGGSTLQNLELGNPEKIRAAMDSPDFQSAVLVGVALYSLVSLLFWHAPALVHWYGISPIKAIFFSSIACLRNLGAYTMYALTWLAFFFVVSTMISLLVSLLGLMSFAPAVLTAFALTMAAMLSTSVYFTFRDSFVHTPDASAELHLPSP